jgi:hypothetical protein
MRRDRYGASSGRVCLSSYWMWLDSYAAGEGRQAKRDTSLLGGRLAMASNVFSNAMSSFFRAFLPMPFVPVAHLHP